MTVEDALTKFQFKHNGGLRGYTLADLRYDLQSGRLVVVKSDEAGGAAEAKSDEEKVSARGKVGRPRKAIAEAECKADAAKRDGVANSDEAEASEVKSERGEASVRRKVGRPRKAAAEAERRAVGADRDKYAQPMTPPATNLSSSAAALAESPHVGKPCQPTSPLPVRRPKAAIGGSSGKAQAAQEKTKVGKHTQDRGSLFQRIHARRGH